MGYIDEFTNHLTAEIQTRKKAEDALHESEKKFMDIFYASDDAILLLDGDIFVDCNEAAVRMLKCETKSDALSTHPSKLSPEIQPDGRPSFEKANAMIAIAFEKGMNRFEWIHRRKTGQDFPVEVTLIAIPFKGKQVLYVVWKDITELKEAETALKKAHQDMEQRIMERTAELQKTTEQLKVDIAERERAQRAFEKSEKRYRAVLEANPDPMVLYDMDGKVIYFNPAFTRVFGWSLDELYGQKLDRFVPEENWPETSQMIQSVIDGVSFSGIESCRYTKFGTKIPVSISGATYKDNLGNTFGSVINLRDISILKQAEEELKKAKETAELASIAKSEFLANMSHEIRTPMNGVIGMSDLLLSTQLTDEQKDYAETISSSANSLLNIINDILDVSKIEAGKLELESIPFNIRTVFDEISDILAPRVFDKPVELAVVVDPDLPVHLKGDPGRIRQIILNLAGNAIKFTEKGEIVIRLNLVEETDTHAALYCTVTDTGIGMSTNDQKRLFKSFSQVDTSTTRKYGGTGLGLSISKQLIELMGGQIGVESAKDEGSTFWFSVNLEKTWPMDQDLPLPETAIKGKRILVVDNHAVNHEVLRNFLKSIDCHFHCATDAKEALNLMHLAAESGYPFDIALINHMLPKMNGEQLGKIIKANTLLEKTRLVMLTSSGIRGDAQKAKKAGFEAYLTKPIRQHHLLTCLAKLLGDIDIPQSDKSKRIITRHTIDEMKNKNVHILLVEDNPVNQKLAIRLLQKMGYTVTAVANGKEAVNILGNIRFNMVLMDVQMPEMDGFKATRIIRDKNSPVLDHDIPIIAMTAHAMKGDREKCIESGMNDYVTKPINPDTLHKTILYYLKMI